MSKGLFRPENHAVKFFSFRSHCLSKLLFSTIVALVVISTAHAAGPLHVNPANPRYFFDSNGTAVYLAGTYLPHEEIELGTSDFTNYLDFLQQQKHNFTRLWAWEQTPSTARNPLLTLAYERTGPGLALDGGAKFDLRRFNQNHFDQLRARVGQAAQRGVYVSVVLFQSLNATSKKDNPWYANPLNRDNNINGINGDTNGNGVGDEAFTLTIPAITTLQEAYIRKVVDTLNNLDNVLYEISADGPLGNLVWQNHIINYLKSYQATKLNQHPIGIGQLSGNNTQDVFASPADWITFYGADLNPPSAAGGKVLFLEANPSLLGDGSSYQSIWKYFTRGFNVIDRELDSLTPGISDGLHGAITQSLAYSQILNLAAMIPSDVICSSGYCLVKPGAEYLAYLPLGGRVLIDLSTAQQSFLVNWFNPITGQTVSGNTVSGGGQVTLTSPFNGEALLHLKIQPQALTSASTMTNTSDTSNVTTLSTSYSASTTSTGSKKTTVSTPTITPNGGTIIPNGVSFAGSISVSLAVATGGATIYYTTDGSFPTQSSPRYSGPITISSDGWLKAQAFKNNANPSSVASLWFAKTSVFDFSLGNSGDVSVIAGASVSNTINATLTSDSTQPLSFKPVSGLPSGASSSFSSTTCNPSCSTALAITTSGSTPAGNFPVTVTSTGGGLTRTTDFTLKVAAAVVSAVATPTITPNGGSFTNSVSVTLATATSGASIYYTTDGSSPTQSSKLYTGAMTLTTSAVVKAKAFKSGYNSSAEASASFASDLVAYWKFDEGTGTTTADSSGNGNTGILTNGPLWTAGRIGSALYFDGTDDIVTVADSNSLHLSNAFTLSAWVNPASPFTDWRAVLVKNSNYYLYASVSGYCGDGSPFGGFSTSIINAACQSSPLPANTWTHLAVAYNGSMVTLYRDGVPVATANATGVLSPSTGSLQIGGSLFGEYFKGLIDEVRIYKTALSDTEIQTIYQQESIGISSTVAAPLISPNGGTYSGSVSLAMQTATSGASIYYTTDGSTPSQSSILYNGSMTLTSSKTVKAKAFKSGYNGSTETDASFIVTQPFSFSLAASANQSVVAGASVSNTISATLDSGSSQAVSFSASGLPSGASGSFSSTTCNPSCSTILAITTSGSTPAGNFPVTVTSTGGGVTRTTVFTLNVAAPVVSTVATPTITPNGGSFTNSVSVTLATATSGASIYYTTDGSSPTQSSKLYTGAMTLTASAIVKAKTFKSGYNPSAEASASFTSNLVAYWKFDEGTGTTTADSSGNGNTGILTNGPLWTAGRIGSALYFDGTDDIVTVADSNSLHLSNAFTLSAWVNPTAIPMDWNAILVKNSRYYLYASTTGGCGNGSPMGGFSTQIINAVCQPSPLPANSWTHLTVTYDGSTLTLYRDGVPVGISTISEAFSFTTETLQIGGSKFGEYFKGLIDEVRVYSRALSSSEIASIYQQESIETSQTVATPLIAPGSGSYAGSVPVALQTATSGASIYYTTNGSTPTQSSTLFTGTMTLTSSATVKAKAFKSGYTASGESSASFTVTQPFDFSVSNAGNKSVVAGSSVTNSIATALASGSSQAVSFTVSGLPAAAIGSFSSTSCAPSCSTVLNISTTGSTPAGDFPITVTSTGGGVTKSTAFTLSVTLALAIVPPSGGTGNAYYVAKNGSDSNSCAQARSQNTAKLTINAGIKCLSAGDTLYIRSGTYYEYLDSNRDVIPSGTSWSNAVTIAAYDGAGTVTLAHPSLTGRNLVNLANNPSTNNDLKYIIIDGLVFDGANVGGVDTGPPEVIGLGYGGVHHIRFINFEVKDAGLNSNPISADMGILAGGTFNEFINCHLHDNGKGVGGRESTGVPWPTGGYGIYINGSDHLIERCRIHDNGGYGIHAYRSGGGVDRITIRYNEVYHNHQAAGITNASAAIIVSSGSYNSVYGNIVRNDFVGIQVNASCSSCLIYNNTVYGNTNAGIELYPGSANIMVKNNISYQNGGGNIADWSGINIIFNNLTTDPRFVNMATNDFHLQSGSPAIDAGLTLTEIAIDMDGTPRPQGTGYDIGAYEYR